MQVNILEARNQLSRLAKAAAAGEDVVIASNGTPLVRLVPIANPRGRLGWGSLRKFRTSVDAAFSPETEQEVERLLTRP